jgi:two-component system cell cycle response regulator DivK
MNAAKGLILIVDDDSRNIFALTAVLKSRGFSCISANSATEALEMLSNTSGIKIVLMDMMMPDMDGYEAVARIRSCDQLSALPVIAVTAQAMLGDKEKCLKAGASSYVAKPINVDELVNLINKHTKL